MRALAPLDADLAVGQLEHAVPDLRQEFSKTRPLRSFTAFGDIDGGIGPNRQLEQVGNPDIDRAEPVPPGLPVLKDYLYDNNSRWRMFCDLVTGEICYG